MAKKGKKGGYSARRKAIQQSLGPSRVSPSKGNSTQGSLPAMMGAPGPDARRVFTFTAPLDGVLCVVEAYFCVPEGLFRLRSSPTSPAQYEPWSRQMMGARDEESMALPQRVAISDALLKRKLWEIGDHVLRGRIGSEVDPHVAKLLGQRTTRPLHPALSLPERGQILSALEMARRPHRVRSFLHTVPQLELKQKWGERGDSALIKSEGSTSAFGLAVREWIGQWGLSSIDELLLDAGWFYAAIGDHDASRTFIDLVSGEGEREARVSEFATDLLVAEYS